MQSETERMPEQTGDDEARFRTTVSLTEKDLTLLDELRVHFRRAEKRSIDRSELIREAIRRFHQDILAR